MMYITYMEDYLDSCLCPSHSVPRTTQNFGNSIFFVRWYDTEFIPPERDAINIFQLRTEKIHVLKCCAVFGTQHNGQSIKQHNLHV